MCGFVAVRSWDAPVARRDVVRALDAIGHRGPDGRGVWAANDDRVVLGHVRLAVRDLAGGAQPIASEDGKVVAAVNGEIYGATALRNALEARGHRFRTNSDSEIVVHAFREWGTGMMPRLRGELAFVLWDEASETLVAGRDRFGVKPLAWSTLGERVVVASRASAILALGVPARWNLPALFQSASLHYAAPTDTVFDGIHELGAGHLLIARRGAVTIERYWDLDYPATSPAPADLSVVRRDLASAFDEAVAERLVADVPVAFQLSGGLDSSAVLASAANHVAAPEAFTVSFADNEGYDEVAAAIATARTLGARLHVVTVRDRQVADTFVDAVTHAEAPCINAHAAAKLILSRAIRAAGFKVVLTGEGADEVLFGYAHFRSDLEGTHARVATSNDASAGLMLPDASGASLSTREVERALGFVPTWISAKAAFGHRARSLVRPDLLERFAGRDAGRDLLAPFDLAGQLHGRPQVAQAAYLWSKLALEGYILRTLGDALEMAGGVEGRLPFLDHVFFEHVRGLPLDLKIHGGVEKWIFREAMRERLPRDVVEREKHPFLAPPMGTATLSLLSDAVASPRFASQPLFDSAKLRDLVARVPTMPRGERKSWDPVLFFALSIAILHDRFGMS